MRRSFSMNWIRNGVAMCVKFEAERFQRSETEGWGWSSMNHTLHDPDTGERLMEIEKAMTQEQWADMAETIDEHFDFEERRD